MISPIRAFAEKSRSGCNWLFILLGNKRGGHHGCHYRGLNVTSCLERALAPNHPRSLPVTSLLDGRFPHTLRRPPYRLYPTKRKRPPTPGAPAHRHPNNLSIQKFIFYVIQFYNAPLPTSARWCESLLTKLLFFLMQKHTRQS